MAEMFREAGYATAYIGKWHLDGHGRESYIPPERRHGWDYWKAAECDHTYNHSHYYTGDCPRKALLAGLRCLRPNRGCPAVSPPPGKGRPAIPAHGFLWSAALSPPDGPAAYKDLYPPEKIQLPSSIPHDLEAKVRQEIQGYYAHCTAVDRCVGEVMATLASAGLAENTILVFTADHGEMMGRTAASPI